MSDYFDHVEQGMREEAVRERRHLPWYARMRLPPPRPALVVVIALLGGRYRPRRHRRAAAPERP